MNNDFSSIETKCNSHPNARPKYVAINAGSGELRCSTCDRLIWETKVGNVAQPAVKRASLSVKSVDCPAKEYAAPNLHKVATKIVADEPMFIPTYQTPGSVCADLVANIPSGETLKLPYRGCHVIDCGFSMELPVGYKAEITPRRKWANRGLLVSDGPGQVPTDYRGRIKVSVLNSGKEIIAINHGDKIAQMAITPVYLFDWMVSSDSEEATGSV